MPPCRVTSSIGQRLDSSRFEGLERGSARTRDRRIAMCLRDQMLRDVMDRHLRLDARRDGLIELRALTGLSRRPPMEVAYLHDDWQQAVHAAQPSEVTITPPAVALGPVTRPQRPARSRG